MLMTSAFSSRLQICSAISFGGDIETHALTNRKLNFTGSRRSRLATSAHSSSIIVNCQQWNLSHVLVHNSSRPRNPLSLNCWIATCEDPPLAQHTQHTSRVQYPLRIQQIQQTPRVQETPRVQYTSFVQYTPSSRVEHTPRVQYISFVQYTPSSRVEHTCAFSKLCAFSRLSTLRAFHRLNERGKTTCAYENRMRI
jgi:hypothetical protein